MKQQARRAVSNYRQVRLTYTEETKGRVNYSIYVKGLGQNWDEHQCVVRDSIRFAEPATSVEDVFRKLEVILAEQRLPESHSD